MAPVIGTVALVGGAIVVAGVAYIVYKNSVKQKPKREFTDSLSTKEDWYKSDKIIIEEAIAKNDLKILNEMLNDRKVKEFPDLIKMIEEALKNK